LYRYSAGADVAADAAKDAEARRALLLQRSTPGGGGGGVISGTLAGAAGAAGVGGSGGSESLSGLDADHAEGHAAATSAHATTTSSYAVSMSHHAAATPAQHLPPGPAVRSSSLLLHVKGVFPSPGHGRASTLRVDAGGGGLEFLLSTKLAAAAAAFTAAVSAISRDTMSTKVGLYKPNPV
jgi:hypothetical protein